MIELRYKSVEEFSRQIYPKLKLQAPLFATVSIIILSRGEQGFKYDLVGTVEHV